MRRTQLFSRTGWRGLLVTLGASLVLGGCAAPTIPSGSLAASPAATATAAVSPTPVCLTATQVGRLPSDRLVGVEVSAGLASDRITFTFAQAQGGEPMGELKPTQPPFVQGASGLPLEVDGDRFVSIIFRGMMITDDNGNPWYRGPNEFKPGGLALRHLVLGEEFEGVISWIAGLRGPGCLTLRREGERVVIVEIAH